MAITNEIGNVYREVLRNGFWTHEVACKSLAGIIVDAHSSCRDGRKRKGAGGEGNLYLREPFSSFLFKWLDGSTYRPGNFNRIVAWGVLIYCAKSKTEGKRVYSRPFLQTISSHRSRKRWRGVDKLNFERIRKGWATFESALNVNLLIDHLYEVSLGSFIVGDVDDKWGVE
jgi:hypothetical protein